MCAVDNESSPSQDALSTVGDDHEGSSNVSSIVEEEELADLEARAAAKSKKVKMMCSYGGRILPRPIDNQLRYVGGETRILVVKKEIGLSDLMAKLSHLARRNVVLKYQLPDEDLDALISVTSAEDLSNMMEEYERMVARDGGSAKLRAFLFPAAPKQDRDREREFGSLKAYQQRKRDHEFLAGDSQKREPLFVQDHVGGHLLRDQGDGFNVEMGQIVHGRACHCAMEASAMLPPRHPPAPRSSPYRQPHHQQHHPQQYHLSTTRNSPKNYANHDDHATTYFHNHPAIHHYHQVHHHRP